MNFTLLLSFATVSSFGQGQSPTIPTVFPATPAIYRQGWIDLNKNGKKDAYEDPAVPTEERIDDLIKRMTLDEKTCQLATLYGYTRVLKDPLPTSGWKKELWKDGIGNIDEHLNGFAGWGQDLKKTPWNWPPSVHAAAINENQRFFIEQTRLGIPVDFTNEGIKGVENELATSFPTPLGVGSTWNVPLAREIGRVTGMEARALGYTNIYSPILDVARDQRWGRCEESYGEDPYLVSQFGVALVRGIQSQNCVATAKHFAVYSASKGAREGYSRTDARATPREIEEIYNMPFREAVEQAGMLGVMSSYNDVNGIPVTGSSEYLIDKLRKEWGFKGYIVSDSDAVEYIFSKHGVAKDKKDAVRHAVMAGLNVRCTFTPPGDYVLPLRELVKEGAVPMSVLDARVRDVLRVKYWLGLFDKPYVNVDDPAMVDRTVMSAESLKAALQASRESVVLLKNEGSVLPLSKSLKRVAVIGPNGNTQEWFHGHYGPIAVPVSSVFEEVKKLLPKAEVRYAKGCDIADKNWPDSELIPELLTEQEKRAMDQAIAEAKRADVAIVVLGDALRTSGESHTRTSLDLPGHQLELIQAIHATGTPVVCVLITGRPMSINWIDKNIPGVLNAHFPGMFGCQALAEALFGDLNPGGKLNCTWPKTVGQIPLNFPTKPSANDEKLGSWKAGVSGPLYPFGYGLSYTKFEYSNLKLSSKRVKQGESVQASVEVKNAGKEKGDEVVQLYIRDVVCSVTTYEKSLRGFERITLMPGEKQTVRFTLRPKDLQILDRKMKWVVEPGEFKVMIGRSSVDTPLSAAFEVK